MSIMDDLCDFCGSYCDPIGCDTARRVDNGWYWCGQCRQGMEHLWGNLPVQEILERADRWQQQYDADPIDWQHHEEITPEAVRHRLDQLDRMDFAWLMRHYADVREREEMAKKHE
jgi:hypothetical protein